MNFWVHLVIAVLLTAYFIFRFIKDRHIYELLFVLWIPSTLLTYVPMIGENPAARTTLGVFQVAMFILVIFFMFRRPKRAKLSDMLSDMAEDNGGEDAPAVVEEEPQDGKKEEQGEKKNDDK